MAVRKNPAVQATEVEFTLHTLGWKAFQDLSAAIASEILGRPVQTFLTSKDGGRDAAFVGTWEGAENLPQNKSTIQCKFIGKPDAKLSLSHLKTELPKAEKLAKDGLAHDYIIITNAKVSAELDAEVAAAFESVGVKRCRTFGYNWLTQTIRASPRLRMMVPRLYGLGDLSQIIDQRAYDQAKYVLSSMGDDLRCFVITDAHRKSVTAYPLDRNIKSFLTYRCDRHFRKRYFDVVGFTDDLIDYMSSELAYDTSANLIARLNQDGILPEELRSQAAAKIMELTIEMPDGVVFDDDDIRSILTDEEFEAIYARFNQQVAERLDDYASELERSIVGDVSGVLMGLKENMERYVRFQKQQPTGVSPRLIKQIEEIEERAAELERETPQHEGSVMPHEARALDKLSEIFDDVDD